MTRSRPLPLLILGGALLLWGASVSVSSFVAPFRTMNQNYRASLRTTQRPLLDRNQAKRMQAASQKSLASIGVGFVASVIGTGCLVTWVLGFGLPGLGGGSDE